MIDEKLANKKEVAELIGCSEKYIEYLTATRQIPVRVFGKKLIRYHPADIRKWINLKKEGPELPITIREKRSE